MTSTLQQPSRDHQGLKVQKLSWCSDIVPSLFVCKLFCFFYVVLFSGALYLQQLCSDKVKIIDLKTQISETNNLVEL